MKKVLAETHRGNLVAYLGKEQRYISVFFILRNRNLEIMVLMFTE